MRTLDEVLADLKAAEKEYSEKCLKYGIEEKHKKKKEPEVVLDENGNPIQNVTDGENKAEETTTAEENKVEQANPVPENSVEEAK